MIWAIVLAAGESRRMGGRKLLLPLSGKTVIETVLENVKATAVEGVVVVLGAGAEDIEKKIKKYDATLILNPDYRSGMLSSVQQGFLKLPSQSRAVLVFLADQPAVKPQAAMALIRAFKETGRGIVVPVFRERRGHPLLVAASFREEIQSLDPGVGLRQLLDRHAEDVLEVPVDDPAVLRDLDTPADYRRERRKAVRRAAKRKSG